MKRILLLLMLPAMVMCQDSVISGSVMGVAWDPVPDDARGGVHSYEVTYEHLDGSNRASINATTAEAYLHFLVEGPYRVGVRTRRTFQDFVSYSAYVWSDLEGYPKPWVILYLENPPSVQKVRVKPIQ